ncbi:hypothetical protein ACFXGR_29505 [Streptomyces mirabilis]
MDERLEGQREAAVHPARQRDHPALLQAEDILDRHQEWLLHRIRH